MMLKKNSVIEPEYNVCGDKGQTVDPGEPITCLHGGYYGIFSKIETASDEKTVNDSMTGILKPEDRFGKHQQKSRHQVVPVKLPTEIKPNTVSKAYNEDNRKSCPIYAQNPCHSQQQSPVGRHDFTLSGNG